MSHIFKFHLRYFTSTLTNRENEKMYIMYVYTLASGATRDLANKLNLLAKQKPVIL